MKFTYPKFTAAKLNQLIDDYFIHIQGEYHLDNNLKESKSTTKVVDTKVWDRQPEPATITGMAFFLGFNSRQSFDDYESNGKHAQILNRGRLRIEAEYEKKLHQQPASGAIFALRSMGWNEKPDESSPIDQSKKTLKVKILETGPLPASNEKDVPLE